MKYFKIGILAICLLMILAACSSGNEDVSAGDDGTVKIGYSINTLNNPFFVAVKEAAEKAAEDAGVSISVVNANNDLATQMSGIEDLIQQQVDVLIIDPVDSKGTVPSVEAANEAGIPVITTGRTIEGGEITTHLGYDEVNNGLVAGEFLVEQINGKGQVIELQGTTGTDVARQRSEGFQQAMANSPDIEIVASQSANFDRAEALSVMENILQANPDIVGVYAANDEMGLGALQAIKALDIPNIMIVSNDGTEDALQAVANGDLAGTMAVSTKEYGETAVEIAIKVTNGEEQPEFNELPSNFISIDNVDEAIN